MSHMYKIANRMRPRRLRGTLGPGSGPEERLKRLRMTVTDLIRFERIECKTYERAEEARGYAELLISMAREKGDRNVECMEMMDYWLLEKDLIHKMFKVLVPRYEDYTSNVTDYHRLQPEYPGVGRYRAVLELRDNPYPSLKPKPRDNSLLLTNQLIAGLRESWESEDSQREKSRGTPKGKRKPDKSGMNTDTFGSSVDPFSFHDESVPKTEVRENLKEKNSSNRHYFSKSTHKKNFKSAHRSEAREKKVVKNSSDDLTFSEMRSDDLNLDFHSASDESVDNVRSHIEKVLSVDTQTKEDLKSTSDMTSFDAPKNEKLQGKKASEHEMSPQSLFSDDSVYSDKGIKTEKKVKSSDRGKTDGRDLFSYIASLSLNSNKN